jgi:hypothetical protein
MFFCENCKQKNKWPGWMPSSRGKCEICSKVAVCYDVPSKYLPLPPRPANRTCLVMTQGLGKHEAHPAHDWWYTSSGGGHQLDDYDPTEKNCVRYRCPGRP